MQWDLLLPCSGLLLLPCSGLPLSLSAGHTPCSIIFESAGVPRWQADLLLLRQRCAGTHMHGAPPRLQAQFTHSAAQNPPLSV